MLISRKIPLSLTFAPFAINTFYTFKQDQHFTELKHKVGIYIQKLVLLISLASLDGKHNIFVTKKERENGQPSLDQADYNMSIFLCDISIVSYGVMFWL